MGAQINSLTRATSPHCAAFQRRIPVHRNSLSSQQYYTCHGNVQLACRKNQLWGIARYRYDGQASMNSNQQRLHALPIVCLALLLAGCKPSEEPRAQAIVGAGLMDGTGGPPISDSVVTIEGSRIRAVGNRTSLPVPADSDKIDGSGKFLVPGLIDLAAPLNTAAGRPGIEQNLNRYLSAGVTSVLSAGAGDRAPLGQAGKAERQGGLLPTRLFLTADAGNVPPIADIFSLADVRVGLDNGAAVFRHM